MRSFVVRPRFAAAVVLLLSLSNFISSGMGASRWRDANSSVAPPAPAKTPAPATDWSRAVVESTMKRYPTAKDLGSWGYAKSLYLYGEYLVYKRTGDPRYLKYIKDWID